MVFGTQEDPKPAKLIERGSSKQRIKLGINECTDNSGKVKIMETVFGAEFKPVVTSQHELLVFSDKWKCFYRLDL